MVQNCVKCFIPQLFQVKQEHSWRQQVICVLKGSSEAGGAFPACCPDTLIFPTDFPKPQPDSLAPGWPERHISQPDL